METTRLVEGLLEHTGGFAKAVAGADPETRVPTCPDWPLRVLVGHLGQSYRWARNSIETGPTPPPNPLDSNPGSPDEWTGWLTQGAEELTNAVLAAGDRPVWAFVGERPATFWLRRMVADAIVHHSDAALTTGVPFEAAPDLAANAISEWFELLSDPVVPTMRPAFAKLSGTGQTLQLRPETGQGWLVTRTPDGVRWARATEAADATLAGPVDDLLMAITGRAPSNRVTVTGDRALVDHWLTYAAA